MGFLPCALRNNTPVWPLQGLLGVLQEGFLLILLNAYEFDLGCNFRGVWITYWSVGGGAFV